MKVEGALVAETSQPGSRESETPPIAAASARDRRWSFLVEACPPLALTLAWSAVFIERSGFVVGGKKYFSLFDDAMISMRYAQNLAHGHGLKWNTTGKPVEGFTNLLWTLWMSFLHLLPGDESKRALYVCATGVLILLGNIVVARAIIRRILPGSRRAAIFACWFVALYYPIMYWTLRGMEVGALALATAGATLLAMRVVERPNARDSVFLVVLLLAAILTRTDAIVPAVVIVAWTVWRMPPSRRPSTAALYGGNLAVGMAIQLGLSKQYYGAWLPNTYYEKVTGIPLTTRLHRGLDGVLSIGILELFLPVTLVALYFLATRRRANPVMVLLVGLFAGQVAYSVYVGGDAWEANQLANRFVATEAIPLLVAAAVAIEAIVKAPVSTRWRLLAAGSCPAAVVLALRVPDVLPGSGMQLGRLPTELPVTRVGTPLLVVAVLGAAAALLRGRPNASVAARSLPAVLAILLVMATSGREVAYWARHNAFLAQDTNSARLGLAVRAATRPGARVAFSAAGASAYFAERYAIDLGGLSDATIAHEPPRASVFIPGHDKYDYKWSVGVLRPDLVIALGATTNSDRAELRSWGYLEVTPYVFVKAGSRLVDVGRLGSVGQYAS